MAGRRRDHGVAADQIIQKGSSRRKDHGLPFRKAPSYHLELSQRCRSGETGVIDHATLSKYLDDLTAPIYYLCGPPGMVTAVRILLNDAGVDDDEIRTEELTGY